MKNDKDKIVVAFPSKTAAILPFGAPVGAKLFVTPDTTVLVAAPQVPAKPNDNRWASPVDMLKYASEEISSRGKAVGGVVVLFSEETGPDTQLTFYNMGCSRRELIGMLHDAISDLA